jgi:hypothetical protein
MDFDNALRTMRSTFVRLVDRLLRRRWQTLSPKANSASLRANPSQKLRPPTLYASEPEYEGLVASGVVQGLSARRLKELIS